MLMKKTMNHQNQIISINCAFKLALILALPISNALSFEIQAYEQKIKNNYGVRSVIEKLPGRELESTLRDFIASGRPNRLVGSPGHQKTQEYLEAKLKSMNSAGASFSKSEFEGTADKKSLTGVNFIWEKKGLVSPDDVIILTANYDTLIKDPKTGKAILKGEMPGADNNASGVSLMLSMMELLNKLNLPKTVKLVFLDFGEFDSQGARSYATSKEFLADKNKKLVGVINLNMLGHDSRTGDKDKKMNNMNLYAHPSDPFAIMLMKSGKENYSTVTFTPTEATTDSKLPADSSFFREAGVPAVTFSQNREGDLNPRYMTSNDFAETLNINTYTNVFRYVTSGVLTWNYDVVK
jgi:Zn-dependent M28 family amino/carboxypeptidase